MRLVFFGLAERNADGSLTMVVSRKVRDINVYVFDAARSVDGRWDVTFDGIPMPDMEVTCLDPCRQPAGLMYVAVAVTLPWDIVPTTLVFEGQKVSGFRVVGREGAPSPIRGGTRLESGETSSLSAQALSMLDKRW